MKSSSGKYYIGLDHLRALAVVMVFCWHFIHSRNIVPLDGSAPWFAPLSLLTQGYTGVSLFMVLSGYLFARLTDGQRLLHGRFWLNRALRLLPLLTVVVVVACLKSIFFTHELDVPHALLWGWLAPTLPQGAWSITVEMHFYLLLPVILWVAARSRAALLVIVAAAIGMRVAIHGLTEYTEYLSYYTMVGRIDQFLLGCLAYQWRSSIQGRHAWWLLAAALFCGLMSYVDHQGSLFSRSTDMSSWWVVMTTIEGVFYGLTVAWYDTSFKHSTGPVSRFAAMVGRYSYSIYLLHTFVVFRLAELIHRQVLSLDSAPLALLAALVCLVLFLPVAALSYTLIEAPFLQRRVRYTVPLSELAEARETAPGEVKGRPAC
ncbi:MAG: acyltransferase [Rubrivivax sp.]|nr:MAG: acyltransferase [Rubrivivax sp.]